MADSAAYMSAFARQGGSPIAIGVYAYMTHMALRGWGRDWLTRGSIERPVPQSAL